MPMMSVMVKEMTERNECMMADMVDKNPEMKRMMGEMMFAMCPQMAGRVIPGGKEKEFIQNMKNSLLTDRGIVSGNGDKAENKKRMKKELEPRKKKLSVPEVEV